MSNLFVTNVRTPTSAHAYMQSFYSENFHIEANNSSAQFPNYGTYQHINTENPYEIFHLGIQLQALHEEQPTPRTTTTTKKSDT